MIKITVKTTTINLSDFIPKIAINPELCTGCGVCGEVCPFGIPTSNQNGKYEMLEPERCTECSACKRNCPTMAIILQEQKGCGCLWNARAVAKNPQNNNCCG